jgi:YebC/PmpR family DNA-binding regulatory protein
MSGHSKWSTIKRKKGAKDAKRAKMFSRIVKEIIVAVKDGGNSDVEFNPRLRLAVNNAKGVNMPKDNIERAIKKGETDEKSLMEVTFEGTGSGGTAIFVECLTDNNQRTVADVRHAFSKYGGSLGKNGSLNYLFDRKGVFVIPKPVMNLEDLELELIDAGLEQLEAEDDKVVITVDYTDFGNMQKKLEGLKIEAENAELQRIPNTYKDLDVPTALSAMNIIEKLEDLEDVQNVFHDINLTDEIISALEEKQ